MRSLLFPARAFVLGLLLLHTLSACSDNQQDDPTPPAPPLGLSWIMSKASVSNVPCADPNPTVANTPADQVTINATSGTGTNSHFLRLIVPKAVGTYSIANSGASVRYVAAPWAGTPSAQTGALYDRWQDASSNITVQSVTATHITGTFAFTMSNLATRGTITASEGVFNVKL